MEKRVCGPSSGRYRNWSGCTE